jgi:chemotaxis protein MotA
MTLFPVGLLVALSSLFAAIHYLKQPASSYYDFVAFAVVIGGTLAVSLIVLPWDLRREVIRSMKLLFFKRNVDHRGVLRSCMTVVVDPRRVSIEEGVPELSRRILQEGAELIELGVSADRIETILNERVFQAGRRMRRVGTAIRNLAKYPPAFGLMGTVLGLVNLMRGISTGLTAQQTGLEMSVALVATMYGLLLANIVINPAGEMILKKAHEDEESAEVALQAVLLAAERVSVLEAQEILNSYVDVRYRIDIVGSFLSKDSQDTGGVAAAA